MPTRKATLSSLTNKLDRVYSQFIRLRDADDNGYVRCCTCNTVRHWKEMHCGHYVPRQHKAVRWDERNTHGQCPGCNTFGNGQPAEYTLFLNKKYGEEIVQELVQAKHRIFKLEKAWLEEKIEYYKQAVENLSKEKC